MKPFNLEEYYKDPSIKVVTSEGAEVRIQHVFEKNAAYPIFAIVYTSTTLNAFYTIDGKYWNDGCESPFDLFFA